MKKYCRFEKVLRIFIVLITFLTVNNLEVSSALIHIADGIMIMGILCLLLKWIGSKISQLTWITFCILEICLLNKWYLNMAFEAFFHYSQLYLGAGIAGMIFIYGIYTLIKEIKESNVRIEQEQTGSPKPNRLMDESLAQPNINYGITGQEDVVRPQEKREMPNADKTGTMYHNTAQNYKNEVEKVVKKPVRHDENKKKNNKSSATYIIIVFGSIIVLGVVVYILTLFMQHPYMELTNQKSVLSNILSIFTLAISIVVCIGVLVGLVVLTVFSVINMLKKGAVQIHILLISGGVMLGTGYLLQNNYISIDDLWSALVKADIFAFPLVIIIFYIGILLLMSMLSAFFERKGDGDINISQRIQDKGGQLAERILKICAGVLDALINFAELLTKDLLSAVLSFLKDEEDIICKVDEERGENNDKTAR